MAWTDGTRNGIVGGFTVPVPRWGPTGARGPLVPTARWPGLHCLRRLFSQPSPPWRSSTSLGLLKFASEANENATTVNGGKTNYTDAHRRSRSFTHWTRYIIIHTNRYRSPQAKSGAVPFWIIKKKSLPSICSVRDTFLKVFPGWISSPARRAQRVENHEYWQDLHLPEKHRGVHAKTPPSPTLRHRCVTRQESRTGGRLTMQRAEPEALYPRYELKGGSGFSFHLKVHLPN